MILLINARALLQKERIVLIKNKSKKQRNYKLIIQFKIIDNQIIYNFIEYHKRVVNQLKNEALIKTINSNKEQILMRTNLKILIETNNSWIKFLIVVIKFL